jgi:hypothetical protein
VNITEEFLYEGCQNNDIDVNHSPIIQAQEELDKFVSVEHSFDEFVPLILKYHNLAQEIPCKAEHVVRMGMYEMRRGDLIHTMVSQAQDLRKQLLVRMTYDYQALCRQ